MAMPQYDQHLANIIDHTVLKPEATITDITKACDEAKKYNFATVCVRVENLPLVAKLLKDSPIKPIAVVSFPHGIDPTPTKVLETQKAIATYAEEVDMVININELKAKNYQAVYNDIAAVVTAAKPYLVKVIIETSNLTNDEKIAACVLAKAAGAHFVKTSTGFGLGGATVEDIRLMRRIVGPDMKIKASGGIRTKEDAEKMVAAGADRIGASASVAIVTGNNATRLGY